jgi:hypothetical protein
MDGGDTESPCPFIREIEQWESLGGAVHADGSIVEKPWGLSKAQMIMELCKEFSCMPSDLMGEDAMTLLHTYKLSNRPPVNNDQDTGEEF